MPTFAPLVHAMLIAMLGLPLAAAAQSPVGVWEFDNAEAPLQKTLGRDLAISGEFELIDGIEKDDRALRLGKGQHLICRTGLTPGPDEQRVNTYTLLFDVLTPLKDSYTALFQTDETNISDNDCEMTGRAKAIGIGDTGYSLSDSLAPDRWTRIAIAVNNAAGRYDIFINGVRALKGFAQPVDGRLSLGSALLLLADDDGDDSTVDITRFAIYDTDLSVEAIATLGTAFPDDPGNTPPSKVNANRSAYAASTDEVVSLSLSITDDQQDDIQFEVDWGDGSFKRWKEYVGSGGSFSLTHQYRLPGSREIRARARDEHGALSDWSRVAVATVVGEPTVALLTKPFLQNVKTDGITIMWETNAAISFELLYGPSRKKADLTRVPTAFDSFISKAVITGLPPDTKVGFELTGGLKAVEHKGNFTTAPEHARPFSFAVWSDSQGHNHGTYEADPYEPTKAMMRHMAESDIEFGVACGDMAEDGASYDDTRKFHLDRIARHLGAKKPFFIAWGNHDARNGSILREFADHPSKTREGFAPGFGSFSFDYAECHFICIDFATGTTDIRTWLEGDLMSEASQEARFTFLFIHMPPYCEIWYDGEAELRETLVPLMEQYGVDVCFSGHTHEYERGELNGVHYVITGGGSWLDHGEKLVKDWPHMTVGGAHDLPGYEHGLVNEYVTLHVDQDAWRAEAHAFNPDGTYVGLIDEFSGAKQ